jgi:hypothetical protein
MNKPLIAVLVAMELLLFFAGCDADSVPAPIEENAPSGQALNETTESHGPAAKLVEIRRFSTPTNRADELILTSNGEILVVHGLSDVETWEVKNGKLLWSNEAENFDHHIESDKELIWLDQSHRPPAIRHIDLLTGQELSRQPLNFDGRRLFNAAFAFNREPPIVATQAEFPDGDHVLLFSASSGELLTDFDMPVDFDGDQVNIQGLGLAANGDRVLVSARGGVILCDERGKVLHRYAIDDSVSHFLDLPQKEWAIGCDNVLGSAVCFFNLENGRLVERNDHRWEATALDVSADGKWAVTGGRSRFSADSNYYFRTDKNEGGEVILWDVASQMPVFKTNPCLDSVGAVAISADGKRIAAAENGDSEGQIIIFEREDSTP